MDILLLYHRRKFSQAGLMKRMRYDGGVCKRVFEGIFSSGD
jgi:hypothetical protein